MFCFSKKYNIKINNKDDIFKKLSNNKLINEEENFVKRELYFIKNTYDISKITNFSDIQNYAIILNKKKKIELELYDKEVYIASLDDIYIGTELLLLFGYEISFCVNNKIYKYNYKNINFYIQHVNEKNYFLTFDEILDEGSINEIIDLFRNKLNINLDDNLYFDIIQSEFDNIK